MNSIKKSDIVLILIVIILVVTYLLIKLFTYKSEPILLDYAKRKSTNMISTLINKSINEVLFSNNYEKIIEIEKDNNGKVENLNFNNKKINELLYLVTDNILNSIKLLENGNYDDLNSDYITNKDKVYYIPIGVIRDIPILVNIGPKIPFKIDVLSSINNDTFTRVKEYGINSSMIEVYLNVNLQVQIILPFKSETFDVNKQILLDSKIIQGSIPDYYGGISTRNVE